MTFQISTRRYDDVALSYDENSEQLAAFCPDCKELITTFEATDSWGSVRTMFDNHERDCGAKDIRPEPEVAQFLDFLAVTEPDEEGGGWPLLVTPYRYVADRFVAAVRQEREADGTDPGCLEVEPLTVALHLPEARPLWRGVWQMAADQATGSVAVELEEITSEPGFVGWDRPMPGEVLFHGGWVRPGVSAAVMVYGWDRDQVVTAGRAKVAELVACGLRLPAPAQ